MTIMRKYILLLCALCAGLVSCVKENFSGAEADGLVAFKASYEAQTKTVLNGLTPYWTPSDKISIYDGRNNEFANSLTSPSKTAEFKGKLGGNEQTYLAASPYNVDLMFDVDKPAVYGLVIPYEQAAVENSYDPTALVSVAYTKTFDLSFSNMCSLIKFEIVSDNVKSVKVVANGGESLSGQYNVTLSGEPKFSPSQGRKPEVILKGDFKNGSTYYISVMPASLQTGLTVYLNDDVKVLEFKNAAALARNAITNIGSLSLNPGESQLPGADEEEDEGVPSGWVIIGQFCDWGDEGALDTYDLGSYYKAFDVPAASLASFKFRNGEVWLGTADEAVVADKWVALSQDGAAPGIVFSGSAAMYDVYLDKELRGFYVTEAGNPSPEPIPAPYVGKSVAGNFNTWNASANPMTEEGDYYVVKGLQLASSNLADPTSNGFKFVDSKGADNATWYGVGVDSIELGLWYGTISGDSKNIVINADATALYDAYISKDMATFCVVAAGSELPEYTPAPLPTVVYLNPGAWNSDSPRFEAYFFGNGEAWATMADTDNDGVFEASVPTGMTNVIFVRMDPNKPEHSWDSKWNQTDDLSLTEGNNCFTFGSWGQDGANDSGTWSLYTPSTTPTPDPNPTPDPDPTPGPTPDPTPGTGEETTEKVRIYLSNAWGWPYLWCWDAAGDQIFTGASWPGTKYHGEENGYYYWDVPEAYVGKTVSLLAVKDEQASEQTSDFNNVVLDKSVYFYLDWTQEKGCHLIQENK